MVLSATTTDSDDRDDAYLEWYLSLYSRTLDLVGDYAGNERFLIEGDSLLRHCFEDSKIDFEGKPNLPISWLRFWFPRSLTD